MECKADFIKTIILKYFSKKKLRFYKILKPPKLDIVSRAKKGKC